MPRPKGSLNKITSEVKDKLHDLLEELISEINIDELDTNQKLKLFQITLQYTIPRMKITNSNEIKDTPLFID
jgi:hypothetical protein